MHEADLRALAFQGEEGGVTWHEFMKIYDSSIKSDEAEFILWERTAYPMAELKDTVKKLRRAIRVKKNNIKDCFCCGMMEPFHSKTCILKDEDEPNH